MCRTGVSPVQRSLSANTPALNRRDARSTFYRHSQRRTRRRTRTLTPCQFGFQPYAQNLSYIHSHKKRMSFSTHPQKLYLLSNFRFWRQPKTNPSSPHGPSLLCRLYDADAWIVVLQYSPELETLYRVQRPKIARDLLY